MVYDFGCTWLTKSSNDGDRLRALQCVFMRGLIHLGFGIQMLAHYKLRAEDDVEETA